MNKPLIFSIILFTFLLSSSTNSQILPLEKPTKVLLREYPDFVRILAQNIKDPKFLAALRAGDRNKDKVDFELDVAYPLSQLIPTQNEIDVEKSLKWPLSEGQCATLASYLKAKGNDTFSPGGPIVTAGGKYIIDGHHRWSQIFLINPQAKIKAVNMKVNEPLNALKFTQMAIASVTEQLPISTVEGQNILIMKKDDFSHWVKDNIAGCAIQAFKEAGIDGKDKIVEYIWSNAKTMQQNNVPIKGAPNRSQMPQTDRAKGWLEALKAGIVLIRSM